MAHRMTSTASSTASFAPAPSVAVDGNIDQSFTSGSCTHTDIETDPWWRVDLGETMEVTGVRIFTPGEGMLAPQHMPSRRSGWAMDRVQVLVSDSESGPFEHCLYKPHGPGPANHHERSMFGDGAAILVLCWLISQLGLAVWVCSCPVGRAITRMASRVCLGGMSP